MSCQRGNAIRTRPQKHRNKTVFKNDRHDTNIRTKRINETQIVNVCVKCKAILEWKIKYKKYKLLKAPKSCNKCQEKTVKQPYHTVCQHCAHDLKICPKCEVPMNYDKHESADGDQVENDDSRLSDLEHSCNDSDINLSEPEENFSEKISKITIKSC